MSSVSIEVQILRSNWTETFLEQGGLEYVMNYFNQSEFATGSNPFHRKKLNFMLTLIRVFLQAYFNNDNTDSVISLLVKKQEQFMQSLNYSQLIIKLLRIIEGIVCRKETEATYHEKIMVSNCLAIIVGCAGYNPSLFLEILTFKNGEELIMSGILYSQQDSIKDDFKQNLYKLARQHYSIDESETALGFLLRVQSNNFEKTSLYPCRHFFGLFNDLVDLYYLKASLSSQDHSVMFNAEKLLC